MVPEWWHVHFSTLNDVKMILHMVRKHIWLLATYYPLISMNNDARLSFICVHTHRQIFLGESSFSKSPKHSQNKKCTRSHQNRGMSSWHVHPYHIEVLVSFIVMFQVCKTYFVAGFVRTSMCPLSFSQTHGCLEEMHAEMCTRVQTTIWQRVHIQLWLDFVELFQSAKPTQKLNVSPLSEWQHVITSTFITIEMLVQVCVQSQVHNASLNLTSVWSERNTGIPQPFISDIKVIRQDMYCVEYILFSFTYLKTTRSERLEQTMARYVLPTQDQPIYVKRYD